MNILSIQSAVAYGHVGNSSAVFPLQLLGAEVWPINTVQFSNHPGYGSHTGAITPPETIRALIDGLEALNILPTCQALLTGYLGDPRTGDTLLHAASRLRLANPAALWCCDPVIGDDAPGIYVKPGIADFFRDQAIPQADILTPNQFELAHLTAIPCTTTAQIRQAVTHLQSRMRPTGPRIVLVTSLNDETTHPTNIDLLTATPDGTLHRLRTPRLNIAPNGAGDAIAALFLFHILNGEPAPTAMANSASSIHGVLRATLAAGQRELALIPARAEILNPTNRFEPEPY
jgi:pyridoxine kinase